MPDATNRWRFVDFDVYQQAAAATAIYPAEAAVVYPALGLANEAGEVLGKIKKSIRDGIKDEDEFKRNVGAEIGDVLWYLAALANDLDLSLGNIAQQNVLKLQSRAERGVLGGSGDDR